MNDGNDDLFEYIYLGRRPDNIPDVPFRLLIQSSVTEIDINAFHNCATLIEIIFHSNITLIGGYAFANCVNLERVELPEGLLRVEEWAFVNCTSLPQIVIPASIQYIGDCVFYSSKSLQRVVFAPRTTSVELGSSIFVNCANLRFVTLPQNLQSIPEECFQGCISLKELQIPVSVEEIGDWAFCDSGIQSIAVIDNDVSESLPETVLLPPNLQSISTECFSGCKSMTKIRISTSVEEIRDCAFAGSSLQSIEIPKNVQLIDFRAFKDCASLGKVTIHSSTNLIMGDDIFANCLSLSVIVMYPWMWPKLFVSMNGHHEFIFKFFRQYQTQIFDFEVNSGRKKRSRNCE